MPYRILNHWVDLAASLGLTGLGILSILQLVQVTLGILLTVLGIISTLIIIRKNTRQNEENAAAGPATGPTPTGNPRSEGPVTGPTGA